MKYMRQQSVIQNIIVLGFIVELKQLLYLHTVKMSAAMRKSDIFLKIVLTVRMLILSDEISMECGHFFFYY